MPTKLTLCGWVLLLFQVGCASPHASIDRTAFGRWSDCYRLSNGTVDVVVAPSAGRIVRYGYVGGANQLWQNPAAQVADATGWQNYGGDKAWVWPQDAWPQLFGHVWPPPHEMDGAPQTAEIIDRSTLRLTSPDFEPGKLRIVRQIHLADDGTTVTIDTQLLAGAGSTFPLAPWTVTQVPPPDLLLAHIANRKPPEKAWSLLQPAAWAKIGPVGGEFLRLQPPPDKQAKLGLDADLLAARHADVLFTLRARVSKNSGPFASGERSQVFSQPPVLYRKPTVPYYELEFTAPRQAILGGESSHLITVWSLTHLAADTPTATIVQAIKTDSGNGPGER